MASLSLSGYKPSYQKGQKEVIFFFCRNITVCGVCGVGTSTCIPRSSGSTNSNRRKSTSSLGYLFCCRGKRTDDAPLQDTKGGDGEYNEKEGEGRKKGEERKEGTGRKEGESRKEKKKSKKMEEGSAGSVRR